MTLRNDPDRILHAKLIGAAMAVLDQVMLAPPETIRPSVDA